MNLRYVWLLTALLACSSSPPPNTLYDDGSQNAPGCPIPPNYSGAVGQTGAFCTDAASDCTPQCCQCSGVANSYWASECIDEACADPQTACDDAPSSQLCAL